MILNPKVLFLIDGLGALLSAFLLGIVLVQFESTFGMPKENLYILATLPCLFAFYDLVCYWKVSEENASFFLKGIALANSFYCCLSIAFVIQDYTALKALGLAYFILELIVLFLLVSIQLKAAFKK